MQARGFLTDRNSPRSHPPDMASPDLRIGRVSMHGHYYAVTFVVAGRRKVFLAADRARRMAHELRPGAAGLRFEPLAWTVMPDHVHLLMQLDTTPLSRCMQVLKSRTSRLVRAGSLEQGGLWQAGYYDHCLRGDEDLRLQARYILENPVRAGIVESPRDYPYSWSLWGLDV